MSRDRSESQEAGARAQYRQGDVLLVATDAFEPGAKDVARVDGRLVLATGEATGHAHAIASPQASLKRTSERRLYLVVDGNEPALLRHEEHAPIRVPPGVYEVRQQRQYVAEANAWRQVRD